MQKMHFGDATIDECAQCCGIWFGSGQIEKTKDEVAPDLRWIDLDIWRRKGDFQVDTAPMLCPCCKNVAMTAISDTNLDTTVRFCAQCRGSWMTGADLEKIINALQTEVDERGVSEYLKESLKQAGDLIVGKKDPISQWKDLRTVMRLLKYRVFVENPTLSAIMKGLQKALPL
jgi:Zn-finger nucleic acid-binding protein